jgi:hypothetical protein
LALAFVLRDQGLMRVLAALIGGLLLAGCTAEGNSFFLGKGETKYFLTMAACEREALSEYDGGGQKYSGFECRQMFLGIFLIDSKTY